MLGSLTLIAIGDLEYIMEVTPISSPPDHYNLSLSTRWDMAKVPEEERRILNLTVNATHLRLLIEGLKSGLASRFEPSGPESKNRGC